MLQVSSNFLHDWEQIKTELATLGREIRSLRTELQEHRVNAMERNSRPWAPTQKRKQKMSGSVTIVPKTDKLQIGVARKCETEKYEKYNLKCPQKGTMFLTRTIALMLSTAVPNTIKMCTDPLIRMMATTQLTKFNLPKKKRGKMNLTKSLLLNQDSFTGTIP